MPLKVMLNIFFNMPKLNTPLNLFCGRFLHLDKWQFCLVGCLISSVFPLSFIPNIEFISKTFSFLSSKHTLLVNYLSSFSPCYPGPSHHLLSPRLLQLPNKWSISPVAPQEYAFKTRARPHHCPSQGLQTPPCLTLLWTTKPYIIWSTSKPLT